MSATGPKLDVFTPKLDVFTIVFQAEIPLLRLQARSLARYFDPNALGEIHVVVNDRDTEACYRAVEAMRDDYGDFRDRVRIWRPEEIMAASEQESLRDRIARWYLSHMRGRLWRFLPRAKRLAGGWRGNNGWRIQQVLKLKSAQVCRAECILMLDAKNHFIAPVTRLDFVSEEGRARSRLVRGTQHRDWVEASFQALGLTPPPVSSQVPPSVTPFVIAREDLLRIEALLVATLGPVDLFLTLRRSRETEFMLIFAAVTKIWGAWDACFADGLQDAKAAFATSQTQDILNLLEQMRQDRGQKVFGVHRRVVARDDAVLKREMTSFLTDRGLVSGAADMEEMFGA